MFKTLKNIVNSFFINQKINNYKYVHIMFNDKFNKPFVDFLNRNFNQKEHVVLCKRFYNEFPFPEGENVLDIKTLKGLNFNKNEKIICHSLFDNELIDYLYKYEYILKNKTYWMIWGGDLYEAKRDKKNDLVRKNFMGYLLIARKDKNVLIVDDILTTGATVNAIARLIKKQAHNIYVACTARTQLSK